jgi:NAD-dependent SIR2 family protein deacetylase
MTYATFVGSADARRRYWARSHVGWRVIARARPNDGHVAVARLQRLGLVAGVVTQNVDGLHDAAGARDVVELHGNLDRVVCLGCGRLSAREDLDERLRLANPAWRAHALRVNPDGDVVLSDADVAAFSVVGCSACGGMLKPDVVFFGENVPKHRVERCYALVESAGCLLVLGSSLTVMSGYRFVRHARRLGIPVVIVNRGPTRGDGDATVKLDVPLTPTLVGFADALTAEHALRRGVPLTA